MVGMAGAAAFTSKLKQAIDGVVPVAIATMSMVRDPREFR